MFKKYWWLVILAIILRLALAFTTFHSDTRTQQLAGQIVSYGNVFNLYDYYKSDGPLADVNKHELFNYPPLIYLFHGFFAFIYSPFLDKSLIVHYLPNPSSAFGNLELNFFLLLTKIPYLIFDLGVAWLLTKLFNDERKKFWVFCLWLFNPVNLYATFMMGQFDIIPTFFVILSLFLVKRNLNWAAVSLGFGAAFKIFPLPLLLPLAFLEKTFLGKVKLIILGLLPYIGSILPYLGSSGFRSTALVASQTDKSFYANLAISGGEKILFYPTLLVLFFFLFYYIKSKSEILWQRYFILLMLFFIFTHTHPQWFLWLSPFLIIEIVSSNFKHFWVNLAMILSFIFLIFSFESALTLGLFTPVWPNLFNSMTTWQMLGFNIDNTYYRSLWQSVFVGAAIYFIYFYFPRKNNE